MNGPIVAEDLYRFRWLDHVRLSPDGESVAYQISWADGEARQNRSRIVVRRLLDAEPVEPTGGVRRDRSPEWSPDGRRLLFVSKVGPAEQLFVSEVYPGGQTRQLTFGSDAVASPKWSPDGRSIAYVRNVLAEPDAVVDDPRPPEGREQARRAPVARIARRLDHKHDGGGFTDGRHDHLFVIPATGGDTKQLTGGAWDVVGFDWAPDGSRLVAAGNSEPDSDLKREFNLYLVALDGKRQRLGGGYFLSNPVWSPRGDQIAFVAPSGPEAGLLERLWVVPLNGERPRCVTAGFDQAIDDSLITDMRAGHGSRVLWSPDGDRLYFQASGSGVTCIYSADLAGNVRQEVGGPRRIYDFDVAGGVIAFCASDPAQPGELYMVTRGAEAKLTDLNPWLRDRAIAMPEHHHFMAPDGWRLEGWILKPHGFDPNRLHPLVMQLHGGPHGQYGWAFFHEFQILASMGFVVFYMNPRGSDGYGERFRREVVQDWAGKDYADLMASLDQIIDRTGYIDVHRMGIAGGSYGGYMTNWIVGQTNRFAAAVSMRSIGNLVSWYAQHDIVPWAVQELGAPPWPVLDELWKRSPIRYVQNVETPLLLTCGELDLRCTISQTEEMFGAMRLLGKTVEMVRFPEESHDLSRNGRPDRRIERLRRIGAWFERFLGTDSIERVDEPTTQVLPVPAEAPQEWARRIAALAALIEVPHDAPDQIAAGAQAQRQAPFDDTPPSAPALFVAPTVPPAVQPFAPFEPRPAPPVAPEPVNVAPTFVPAPAAPEIYVLPAQPQQALEAERAPAPTPTADFYVAPTVPPNVEPPYAPPQPDIYLGSTVPPGVSPDETYAPPPVSDAPGPSAAIEEEPAAPAPMPAAPAPPPAVEAAELAEAVVLQPEVAEPIEPSPAPSRATPGSNGIRDTTPPLTPFTIHEADTPPAAAAPAPPAQPPSAPAPMVEPPRIAPQAPRAPEPQPAGTSAYSTQPGVAAGSYSGVESTIVAWPTGPGTTRSTAGAPAPESIDEATSIIPVWRHPNSSPESTRTVSLQAVPPEEIAAGKGFAARLTFETGPFAGRIVAVPLDMVTIGRALDNDIVVGDPATSAHHGRIEVRGGTFWISDLGSTNGTLVNGEPIIDKQLGTRDLIAIGQNTMRFTLEA